MPNSMRCERGLWIDSYHLARRDRDIPCLHDSGALDYNVDMFRGLADRIRMLAGPALQASSDDARADLPRSRIWCPVA